jgi:hypothetical protein
MDTLKTLKYNTAEILALIATEEAINNNVITHCKSWIDVYGEERFFEYLLSIYDKDFKKLQSTEHEITTPVRAIILQRIRKFKLQQLINHCSKNDI